MKLTLYQADAFTEKVFSGNPAAVVPLQEWLPDQTMQNIAEENNLSETAFFIPDNQDFHIRWFTPTTEVNLCGHATLASAHVLFNHLGYPEPQIRFQSKSDLLKVKKAGDLLVLDFPVSELKETDLPEKTLKAFNIKPEKCYKGREDLLFVYHEEKEIQSLQPDFLSLKTLGSRGVIATAPASDSAFDFVSRFFAPGAGIDEDPVTESAHTMLIPYWAKKLGKNEMVARQISKRGGIIYCKNLGQRVEIGGKAVTFLKGEIVI